MNKLKFISYSIYLNFLFKNEFSHIRNTISKIYGFEVFSFIAVSI